MKRLACATIVAGACALAPLPISAQTAAGAWIACLNQAADALYTQPEPAYAIAAAAFSICSAEEAAWRAERAPYVSFADILDQVKADTATGMVLERVMINRAAKMKGQDQAPPSRTAPLYKPT